MKAKIIPKLTVIVGILLLIIAYIIPYDSLESIVGQGPRPIGLVSIFINPILGIIGSGFSIYKKQWLYLLLNIILIFTFFVIIAMFGFV
ncbi:hypothetical protein GOQ27_01445 [Clostridium sp. D2Q-11]|uniref:Uncharacterized protein n=1 Tax=Anaeromonas frigoriresistens TaxID=2683708 RepID=A0A942USG2_9FIRM|nr:hypothetical protein [Anaeromonas frigoriresistens]MBS4537105.1 hypothetical protein [Anaeromonas frigoriresistens]